jgi:hypothetical protein
MILYQFLRSKLYTNITIVVLIIIGFIVKLPAVFHHYDKELHAAFYFFATILQFPKKWLLVLFCLLIFGFGIELAQAFSNKISIRLIGKSIHGRFDIEDIRYNIKGLFLGSAMLLLKLKGKNLKN